MPPGTIQLFCWDSFFNALLASLVDPETARDTVRAILGLQLPNGMVPNFGTPRQIGSPDRSGMPVGALCVWKLHQRHPDKAFLEEVYPKLVRWHDWWFATNPRTGLPNRDGNRDGLLEWGSETGDIQQMKVETLDDSPMWDEVVGDPVSRTMDLDAVDLNFGWAMDADHLALLAGALGRVDDAQRFRQERDRMNDRMNRLLWNGRAGIYCNRYWQSRYETYRQTPQPIPQDCLRTPTGQPGLYREYFGGAGCYTRGPVS